MENDVAKSAPEAAPNAAETAVLVLDDQGIAPVLVDEAVIVVPSGLEVAEPKPPQAAPVEPSEDLEVVDPRRRTDTRAVAGEGARADSEERAAASEAGPGLAVEARVGRSTGEHLREVLAKNAAAQLGVLAIAGIAVVAVWTSRDHSRSYPAVLPPAPRTSDVEVRAFPKIELRGAERVKAEDVDVLFRERKRPPVEAAGDTRDGAPDRDRGKGVVVLKPGQLVDPDAADPIVVVEPGEVGRRERRAASRAVEDGRAPSKSPTGGRYFAPGGLLTGAPIKKSSSESSLGLKTGDRLKVKLEVGIVSSVHEEVIATLLEDVVRDGRRVLEKGDVLRGHASNDDKRVFIRFQSVDTGEHPRAVSGYAIEKQMPGLRARRREATVEERSQKSVASSVVGGVAREAGAMLAGGGAVGRVVEGAANGVASESRESMKVDTSWVLEVPAGRTFEIVVTEDSKS